jgi:predicted  nucleic acid-binding Zn ribbon protein
MNLAVIILLMILTKWQIRWRRLDRLQFSYSIIYQEHHSQTPADMNIQVTVHYPGTYISQTEMVEFISM